MTLIIEKAKINKEEKFKLSANKLSNLQLKTEVSLFWKSY
jgi:hypothetical protein